MSEVFSISGKNIHEAARASVISALSEVAGMKNVPLDRALREYLAGCVLDRMDFPSIHRVSCHEQDGLIAMVKEVNKHLDATAMVRLRHLISAVEGKESLDDPAVEAAAQAIVAKFVATLPKQGCPRWPDLVDMVSDYYATVPRGPITKEEPDGTTITAYWLGPDPHRDPREGPAVHWARGEKHGCEYWVKGELHRDHRDGPAMIYTHYKNFDLSGVEYFENGKRHRPSELGPAVTHWDREGRAVMELYFENGAHHRDPNEGPAWWQIHDARTNRNAGRPFIELRYCVRGQPHRDEKDGPAWIKRDNETGVLVTEEYWRNGVLHRENGPAIVHHSPDGVVRYEAHWRGDQYRDASEGPATIVYDAEGRVEVQEWFGADGKHREAAEGPARISHDHAMGWVREDFYVSGKYRPASLGPASVTRDQAGNAVREEFWDGERMHLQPPEPIVAEASAHG